MPNILFSYLYRDGANYKNYGEVVFANPTNLSLTTIKETIESKLLDGEWFYAHKWNLPDLHFEKWDIEIDHTFHEFEGVEETDRAPTDTRTINEFIVSLPSFMESLPSFHHP